MFSTKYASITGIELARSDPNTIYLAMSTLQAQRPYIVRSTDAGESWTEINLSAQLDLKPLIIRILAVDPGDARTLYIRLSDGKRDALAITRDGGATIRVAQQLETRMSAFQQRADATLIVASADGMSFRSDDAGASFSPWTSASNALHFQALAERDGVLFATTSSRSDGFAVATSSDDGEHWRPLLRLDQLRGPLACGAVKSQCEHQWTQLKPSLTALAGPALEPEPQAAQPAAGGGCAIASARHADARASGLGPWCAALLFACRRVFSRGTQWRLSDEEDKT
jgi:hypothetical protein